MASSFNYRGVLLDSIQYRQVCNLIVYKNVIHFSLPSSRGEQDEYLDSLWFRIGYTNAMTLLVALKPHETLTRLVYSGLVYDMRGHTIPSSSGGLYDLLHEILSGKSTRIGICNEIRDVLASRENIRWCGAEEESIFNEKIYTNSSEICGNKPPGSYFSIISRMCGRVPVPMHEKHLRDLFIDTITTFNEPGQRKLGLMA